MCVCVYGAECSSQAVQRRWILQKNPVAPGSVGVAVLLLGPAPTRGRALALRGRAEHLHLPPAPPGGATAAPPLPQHRGGCCTPLRCQRLEQTHLESHLCHWKAISIYWSIFWLRSDDCPAAFGSCDITVSNSYIYIYVYRYYNFLNSETLCAQTQL